MGQLLQYLDINVATDRLRWSTMKEEKASHSKIVGNPSSLVHVIVYPAQGQQWKAGWSSEAKDNSDVGTEAKT